MTQHDPLRPSRTLPARTKGCLFWEDRPRPGFDPKLVGVLLTEVLQTRAPVRTRKTSSIADGLVRVELIWESVVGPLRESTRVGRYREGILDVIVDSAALKQDLSFAVSDLVVDLESAGLQGIHEVRFKVGRV